MRPSAIVLAGGKEAWAERFGVGSKALVPYRGRPMVEWVLEALYAAGLSPVYVGENPGLVPAPALTLPDRGGLLENLEQALEHVEGRVLVATGDIPHLTEEAVRFVLDKAPEAALVYPIVPKEAVEARFPRTKRTYARLREGTFSFWTSPSSGRPFPWPGGWWPCARGLWPWPAAWGGTGC